jgi:hypothetical protein
VKELIEVRNADLNARIGGQTTALRHAKSYGHSNIVAYLISHGGIE